MAEFLNDDPHDGGPRSSVAGVAEPGNLTNTANTNGQPIQGKNVVRLPPIQGKGASNRKKEATRQHYLRKEKDNYPDWVHRQVMEAGYNKLDKPYMSLQINDLRDRDVNKKGFSVLVDNTEKDMSLLSWRDFLMVAPVAGAAANLAIDNDSFALTRDAA